MWQIYNPSCSLNSKSNDGERHAKNASENTPPASGIAAVFMIGYAAVAG